MKNNITYVFSGPRKDSYINNSVEAKEFYYGVFNPEFDKSRIKIVDFQSKKKHTQFTTSIFFLIKYLQNYLALPFYTAKLTTFENF